MEKQPRSLRSAEVKPNSESSKNQTCTKFASRRDEIKRGKMLQSVQMKLGKRHERPACKSQKNKEDSRCVMSIDPST